MADLLPSVEAYHAPSPAEAAGGGGAPPRLSAEGQRLQPVPSLWTTLRLVFTWHWAAAGQHTQASRAREQASAAPQL